MAKRITVAELDEKLNAHCVASEPIATTVTTMTGDVAKIKTDVAAILERLDTVKVINGGGREVSFASRDFFQMIYDRPKEAFNRATSYSEKGYAILRFVAYSGAVIYFLTGLIKII